MTDFVSGCFDKLFPLKCGFSSKNAKTFYNNNNDNKNNNDSHNNDDNNNNNDDNDNDDNIYIYTSERNCHEL